MLDASWTRTPLALRKKISSWVRGSASGQMLAFSDEAVFGFRSADGDGKLFGEGPRKWSLTVARPKQVEALLLTREHVVAAGAADRYSRGDKGGFLLLVSQNDGKMKSRMSLPSPPVYDGMAAAAGRLYVSAEDGHLYCYGD